MKMKKYLAIFTIILSVFCAIVVYGDSISEAIVETMHESLGSSDVTSEETAEIEAEGEETTEGELETETESAETEEEESERVEPSEDETPAESAEEETMMPEPESEETTEEVTNEAETETRALEETLPETEAAKLEIPDSDIAGAGQYVTKVGEISSYDDVVEYDIAIDFTEMSKAVVCNIQTGDGYAWVEVFDENGIKVGGAGAGIRSLTAMYSSAWWCFINKPEQDGISNYKVRVKCPTGTLLGDSNSFNMHYGDAEVLQKMVSGEQNTIQLIPFFNRDSDGSWVNNRCNSNIVPQPDFDHIYKFVPRAKTTTISLATNDENANALQFKVIDPSGEQFLYSTERDSQADRREWIGQYDYVKKAKLTGLDIGKEYELIVFASDSMSATPNEGYQLYVGEGYWTSDYLRVNAKQSYTATTTAFSKPANIIPENVPTTAIVERVKINTSNGIKMYQIEPFQVKLLSEMYWTSNQNFSYAIDFPIKYGSDKNKSLNTTWQVRFKGSSSTITFTPGLTFDYVYEMGD